VKVSFPVEIEGKALRQAGHQDNFINQGLAE
jgi:hypothetical protein